MLELICKNLRRRRSQLAIQAVELVADLLLTKKKVRIKLLRSCAQLWR